VTLGPGRKEEGFLFVSEKNPVAAQREKTVNKDLVRN